MGIELKAPSVGESITEVQIGTWLVSEGGAVEKDQAVVEIESEKATVEVFAPSDGTLTKILKQTGETCNVGDVIGEMEEGEASSKKSESKEEEPEPAETSADESGNGQKPKPAPEPEPEPAGVAAERESGEDAGGGFVMPAARRVIAEAGLDAAAIKGTGPGGRILKEDAIRAAAKPAGAAAQAATNGQEVVRMSPMRRTIAARLVEAQQTAALLTTFNEADLSAVIALRKDHQDEFVKKYGIKLGFMSFFVKAAVDALKRHPAVNAEIQGENIVYNNRYEIGIAVGGGKGLVVPVVRNADAKSFAEVELTIADFGKRAQENKIGMDELKGGTFTISNGGIYGSMLSTPIVNPPQSGILGLHAIQDRPVAVDGEVVIRPMMYLALTYDHRIVDGREAVTFLKRVKECIEKPSRMLLEI
jgi:2-oxoglutarate dehydrogenase E2 component (dihydrolipoamide succinyltransferase)